MIIGKLDKVQKLDKIVYSRIIKFDSGEEHEMWIELEEKDDELYCTDRADGYLVALLLTAMIRNESIELLSPISATLLDSVRKYLIPFLCGINKSLHSIDIIAKPIEDLTTVSNKLIGTGCSCGVDSLSTFIYHNIEETDATLRINTLTLFNSGYYGTGDKAQQRFPPYLDRSKKFCDEVNCRFLSVNSNFSDFCDATFLQSHTYLTCAIVLLLQCGFSRYYYSSGYPVFSFKCEFDDPAFYDIYLLSCISTGSLKFISSCCTMSRVEKVKMITRFLDVAKYLYVCTSGKVIVNCGKCEKCIRTLLAADSIGMIDSLSRTFDVTDFIRKRMLYHGYMLRQKSRNIFYEEIFREYQKQHRISAFSWCYVFIPCHLDFQHMKTALSRVKRKVISILNFPESH